MARKLTKFTISEDGEDYLLHIEDDGGETIQFTATYDQLDVSSRRSTRTSTRTARNSTKSRTRTAPAAAAGPPSRHNNARRAAPAAALAAAQTSIAP